MKTLQSRLYKRLLCGTVACISASCIAGALATELTIQDVRGRAGNWVLTTIEISSAPGLSGADLRMALPEFAIPGEAEADGTSSEFLFASRARAGAAHIAMARSSKSQDGQTVRVRIPIRIGDAAVAGSYAMSMTRLRLFDSDGNAIESVVNSGNLHVLPPATDLDEDGLDDDWEIDYFRTTNVTGDDDEDGDGASNRHEFFAGTDPNSADSLLLVRKIEAMARNGVRDIVLEWNGRSDRDYEIYWSDGPLGPDMTWRPVYNPNIPRNEGRLQWTDNGTRTLRTPQAVHERFYRIMVKPGNAAPGR